MITLDKKKIAERLREFIKTKFDDKPSKLAKKLAISHQALQTAYLTGHSIPGPALLVKLLEEGCDIIWLLTGKRDLWKSDSIYNERITDLVKKLHEEYYYSEEIEQPLLDMTNPQENDNYNSYWVSVVLWHWKEHGSITPSDLANLSSLMDIDLFWILTGHYPSEKFTDKDHIYPKSSIYNFSDGDLEIIKKLNSIPEHKKSILKLIDSKVSEKEALDTLKK